MQNEKNNRKVLLEIRDVKQYFPVKKTKFREKQRYVRANDGITLDIYEGETLGLVGESGCGKSTLGRTILQLYPQTHGDILYHKGEETIDLVCPSEYAIQRLMQKGLIKKLDKSKIANDVNVDDMIYTKAVLSVFSLLWIREILLERWYIRGEDPKLETVCRAAWEYAREIEHSDENLNLLEEIFNGSALYKPENFLPGLTI